MNISEAIPTAFEIWWEKDGAQLYATLISSQSIHRASKLLALAAFEQGVPAGYDSKDYNPDEKPAESDPRPTAAELEAVAAAAPPAGPDKSARVLCGACQNCGLENHIEAENITFECSGCKYVGFPVGVFSRPAV
jgi:hypothetical protein